MNKLIRILLLSAAILLCFCAFTESDDFFCYETADDGSVTIVGYTGYDRTVTIPETVDGLKVKRIGTTAFYGNENLRTLIIKADLECVEKDAFAYCPNLRKVSFEGRCPILWESSFEGCQLLREMKLPEDLETIDNFAFKNCVRLGQVNIPESVSLIGYQAFAGCDKLVLLTGDNQTAIQYAAENSIDTSFGESNDSMWLKIVGFTGLALLVIAAIIFIKRYFF